MTAISSHSHAARTLPAPQTLKPLFREGETPTAQDSVFFRESDQVRTGDWGCHLDRFKSIDDKKHPDYMNRGLGFLASTAAVAAGLATSLITAPYSLSLVAPIIGGTTQWATGSQDQGLLSTIGTHLTLPLTGAGKVADTVFEKVAGTFYNGNGPTIAYLQDENGTVWGVPHDNRS